jgi:hypothetical protein
MGPTTIDEFHAILMAIMQLFDIVGLTQDFLRRSKTEYPTLTPNMVGLSALLLYTYMVNGVANAIDEMESQYHGMRSEAHHLMNAYDKMCPTLPECEDELLCDLYGIIEPKKSCFQEIRMAKNLLSHLKKILDDLQAEEDAYKAHLAPQMAETSAVESASQDIGEADDPVEASGIEEDTDSTTSGSDSFVQVARSDASSA